MKKRKIGIFGIGPWLALIALFYFSQAVIISLDHLNYFRFVIVNRTVDESAGMILFLAGTLYFLAVHGWFLPAWFKERLAVTGPYRLCRHPMYAALILMILPALGLISHSWLVWWNVAVTYIAFKLLIKREDRKLEAAFGPEYLAYRSGTNELLPWLRREPRQGKRGQ